MPKKTPFDIDERMSSGSGRRRKVKRHFTPFAWLQRQISAKSIRTSSRQRGFRMESPDDRLGLLVARASRNAVRPTCADVP